jgi:DNA-binding FrmR family transcriptional regulator
MRRRMMPTTKRQTPLASPTKHVLLSRLRTIEGHVRGILRMVEADTYCPEVLTQALAVQRAIDRFSLELLEQHLDTCFVAAVRGDSQQDRERALREILSLFEASIKFKGARRLPVSEGSRRPETRCVSHTCAEPPPTVLEGQSWS